MMPAARAAVTGALSALVFCCAGAGPLMAWRAPCPPCKEPQSDGIPFQWDDGASGPPEVGPYPQGFALTVPVTPGQRASDVSTAPLSRYVDIGLALGRCWSAALAPDDAHWRDLTVRVSFRRDGHVNGVPRVVHVSDPSDSEASARAKQSLFSALGHCTPLALSPTLGQAIAGQIFAIRFTQQRIS